MMKTKANAVLTALEELYPEVKCGLEWEGDPYRLLVMAILKKINFLSAVGVSVAGGVLHNVGQILMAILLLGTAELGYYLIVLTVTGTIAGIFIGLCASLAVKKIPIKKCN